LDAAVHCQQSFNCTSLRGSTNGRPQTSKTNSTSKTPALQCDSCAQRLLGLAAPRVDLKVVNGVSGILRPVGVT
jgi:hypothetical protein